MNRRFLAAVALLAAAVLVGGCGDTIRPIVTPEPKPGGDPEALRYAVVVHENAAADGSTLQINVSGDTAIAQVNTGRGPQHVAFSFGASRVYVANSDSDTLTSYSTFFPTLAPVTTTLPAGAHPIFLNSTSAGLMYVANQGNNTVAAINTGSNAVSATVNVGAAPVSLAQTPDTTKLYVANSGDDTISVIATVDHTILTTIALPAGAQPVWVEADTRAPLMFVANAGNGTISVISTETDTVLTTIAVGGSPTFLLYDPRLRRVYAADPGSDSVHIVRSDQDPSVTPPSLLASVPVGTDPVSVTALADGSRAYVANAGSDNVSVITTSNNQVTSTIAVGDEPVFVESAPDSSKVYVANRSGGSISVIRASDNTVVVTIPSPKADPNCTSSCARQQPLFIAVTP